MKYKEKLIFVISFVTVSLTAINRRQGQ